MSWLQSNVNGELYTSVLEEEYKETLKYYGLQSSDMIFQLDNLWYDLAAPEYCRNLIRSTPRRVRDVIQRKGRDTKY
ncbi:hypothetical protein G6F46_013013 [Rhizopus delemar]|nr:hypothetical protein G6F53_012895 [Rhizopus delemar]KAG1606432.1 hypothetical protein G6F46_013013 [Rhizopus delemar]